MKALKDSFHPKQLNLVEKSQRKARKQPSDKQDKRGQTAPQQKGTEIHLRLANEIKKAKDSRNDTEGKILEKIEKKFSCEFIQAEVRISGFAVNTRDSCGKLTQDFWSGHMDAVAIRRKKGVLEVFVVDWKTSAKAGEQLMEKWWKNATNFKGPLYQCLVYRELLQAHFKHNDVVAKVGIMLVPFHQSDPEIIHPGLCVNFRRMEKLLLMNGLKKFEWYAVLDESIYVHTIKIPCKLIKDSFNPADYVDERTNYLKRETRLKDIFNDNATVADLCLSLDLSFMKVESIKKEEKTNEDLEEVNKKCLRHVPYYGLFNATQAVTKESLKTSRLQHLLRTETNYQLPVGLISQLVKHCNGIAEVMGSNPVQAWIFSFLSLLR